MDVVSLLGVTGVVGTLMFAVREIRRRVKGGGGRKVTEVPGQSNLVPESVYGEQGVREMYGRLDRVIAGHADCTAEVLSLAVCDARNAARMKRLRPGDQVELRARDKAYAVGVDVYADGCRMGELLCGEESRVPSLVADGATVEAYLGGRDLDYYHHDCDFCSIIVFYRIPGVPPTRVDVV